MSSGAWQVFWVSPQVDNLHGEDAQHCTVVFRVMGLTVLTTQDIQFQSSVDPKSSQLWLTTCDMLLSTQRYQCRKFLACTRKEEYHSWYWSTHLPHLCVGCGMAYESDKKHIADQLADMFKQLSVWSHRLLHHAF